MLVSFSQPLEIIIKFARDFFFFPDRIFKVLGNLKQIVTKKIWRQLKKSGKITPLYSIIYPKFELGTLCLNLHLLAQILSLTNWLA